MRKVIDPPASFRALIDPASCLRGSCHGTDLAAGRVCTSDEGGVATVSSICRDRLSGCGPVLVVEVPSFVAAGLGALGFLRSGLSSDSSGTVLVRPRSLAWNCAADLAPRSIPDRDRLNLRGAADPFRILVAAHVLSQPHPACGHAPSWALPDRAGRCGQDNRPGHAHASETGSSKPHLFPRHCASCSSRCSPR